MTINIDGVLYNVLIIKKRTTKNTYIRVNSNLEIVVTCNALTSKLYISKLINENINSIKRMINIELKKKEFNDSYYYLGKKYDLVYINENKVILGENKIFIGKNIDFEKWLKKEAAKLFQERLDYNYNKFSKKIPYPKLCIRKMKTRWGVCNYKDIKVTLNLELMKKDIECLDYVIMHELSHFIHHDHSNKFWKLVEENYPNYKYIRKIMKDY